MYYFEKGEGQGWCRLIIVNSESDRNYSHGMYCIKVILVSAFLVVPSSHDVLSQSKQLLLSSLVPLLLFLIMFRWLL